MAGDESFNRRLAIKAAYQSAKDRLELSEEEFIKAVESWDVYPVTGGAVLINGEQIHACVLPDAHGRWLSRRVLKETIGAVLRKHGRAVTSVRLGNESGERFVARLGFQKIEEKEGIGIWELKLR
jgi:GNAT superfamily N-acetyltransferase